MNSSPTITKIAEALVKSQKEMGNAKKEAINPFFKKSYADLNSVREATLPVLNANGISVIQPTCVIEGINYVETILLHESGEYISSLTQIITDKPNDAQRHGSGLSYARRYALASIANIGAEDDDANTANVPANGSPKQVKKPAFKVPVDNQAANFYPLWQTEVDAITNPTDLLTLYNTHAATVSEDEKLKLMFKTKQATFKLVKS